MQYSSSVHHSIFKSAILECTIFQYCTLYNIPAFRITVCPTLTLSSMCCKAEAKRTETRHDDYHHKATRTLFVGNLEPSVTKEQLQQVFDKYGFLIVCILLSSLSHLSFFFVCLFGDCTSDVHSNLGV